MIGALKYYHKHRNLLYNFVVRDLRGKYAGSTFGLFWTVIQPLIMMAVYTIIFSVILDIQMKEGAGPLESALLIFCGMVPWLAFAEGLQRATSSIVDNANLIKKVAFPTGILPSHIIISSMINMLAGMALLIIALLVFRGAVSPALLFVLVMMLLQFIFAVGLAWFFSAVNVFFRDTVHLMAPLLMIWMFCTPIFYPMEIVTNNASLPPAFKTLYSANPMGLLIRSYQCLFFDGTLPPVHLPLAFAAAALIAAVVGYLTFSRSQKKFPDLV